MMRPGFLVLTMLILALLAIPVIPGSDGMDDQAGVVSTSCGNEYRGGRGHEGLAGPFMNGVTKGNGPGPRAGPMPHSPGGQHGRARPVNACVRDELRRDPLDLSSPVRVLRFCGYRRLSRKNILDHEKRHLIYTTVSMNPGIDLATVSYLTGINLNTMRYHLGHLIRNGKIACIEHGGGYHLFENHGRYGRSDQLQILLQGTPTSSRIIGMIQQNPGITRGEIAQRLGIAGPSVTRWMHRLLAEEMVTEVRDGRVVQYYPGLHTPDLDT